jgi:hypothetical protein
VLRPSSPKSDSNPKQPSAADARDQLERLLRGPAYVISMLLTACPGEGCGRGRGQAARLGCDLDEERLEADLSLGGETLKAGGWRLMRIGKTRRMT